MHWNSMKENCKYATLGKSKGNAKWIAIRIPGIGRAKIRTLKVVKRTPISLVEDFKESSD